MVSASSNRNAAEGERRQHARAEAAIWVVATRSEAEPALPGLGRWLSEDGANATAYGEMLTVWSELGQVLPDQKAPDWAGLRSRPRVAAAAGLVCALFLCVLGWNLLLAHPSYRTGVGEQRVVQLDDGSRVTLNTDSELAVLGSGKERRLELNSGEALFEVAHDPKRPFIVVAGARQVRAIGTSFIVRREAQRLDVVLLSGVVRVEGGAAQAVRLTPGERFHLGASGVPALDRPKIDTVTAWRTGDLLLSQTPLPEAVAEMNRYTKRRIVLRSERARTLTLSGAFKVDETEGFARTVGTIFGFGVRVTPDELTIADPAGTPQR